MTYSGEDYRVDRLDIALEMEQWAERLHRLGPFFHIQCDIESIKDNAALG